MHNPFIPLTKNIPIETNNMSHFSIHDIILIYTSLSYVTGY